MLQESTKKEKTNQDTQKVLQRVMEKKPKVKTRQDSLCLDEPPHNSLGAVRWCRPVSANAAFCSAPDSDSNSEKSSPVAFGPLTFALHSLPRFLPPVGVFWDIENCQVPKGRSAVAVAQAIRDRFFVGYREAEFLVVCDVLKENSQIVQELNDAQVNLIHVASTCKNAADEKLRQSIRRFADLHGSPACIILISGDINFAADISDLRHRKKIHVILLHKHNTSEALILCASENYSFSAIAEALPPRGTVKPNKPFEILVNNLPEDKDQSKVKNRLKKLSDNCGGKISTINRTSATIRFPSADFASRALKRMNGEDVFGSKISVTGPAKSAEKRESSPLKTQPVRKNRSARPQKEETSIPAMSSGYYQMHTSPSTSLYSSAPSLTILSGNGYTCQQGNLQNQDLNFPHDRSRNAWSAHNFQARPAVGDGNKTPEGYRRIRGACWGQDNVVQGIATSLPNSVIKHCRTPSPLVNSGVLHRADSAPRPHYQNVSDHRVSPFILTPAQSVNGEGSELGNPEHFFHPIPMTPKTSQGQTSENPIELQVTNLDRCLGVGEVKEILSSLFKEYVTVLNISVVQLDGSFVGFVKVPSLADAQYAISRLHRYRVGVRRIRISYSNTAGPSPQVIRSQVISMLLEVPEHRLPLFKFRELFESRYLTSISVSEIYKLRDVCAVLESSNGRIVALNPDHRHTPSPCLTVQESQPFCILHATKPQPDKGWAEQEMNSLPNVNISLKKLSANIQALLQSHGGSFPLPSLPSCYEATFGTLEISEDGVPLEHLVSCLHDVKVVPGAAGCVKRITWNYLKTDSLSESNSMSDASDKAVSPPLVTQLTLLSRELVDLLKIQPGCQLAFARFVPSYHHHFGRQIRVADYGFTKLIDLLEAIPNVVQVLGEGSRRIVTLTHRAQVRRFTSDLLRALKAQASKQAHVSQLPSLFSRVLNRNFTIQDYGVCDIYDMLESVSENVVVLQRSSNDDDATVSIPRREQTLEERQRTELFSQEVLELLSYAPQNQIMFNKLIPAYHHHFGRQCRVADYGFTKLIELLEAIPHVIKIEETVDGDRRVVLTRSEALRVLAQQIALLIRSSGSEMLHISAVPRVYLQQFGYALRPESFGCDSLEQLCLLLSDTLQVLPDNYISLGDKENVLHLELRVLRVLLDAPEGKMKVPAFLKMFAKYFHAPVTLEELNRDLDKVVFINAGTVSLTPLYLFARRSYWLLVESGGHMPLAALYSSHQRRYGAPIQPAQFGFATLAAMVQAVRSVLKLEILNAEMVVQINSQLSSVGMPLPPSLIKTLEVNSDEQNGHVISKDLLNIKNSPGGSKELTNVSCANSEGGRENGHTNILNAVSCSNGVERNGARPTTSKGKITSLAVRQIWGGFSPPMYAPYCVGTPFSPFKGPTSPGVSSWPQVVPPDPSELPQPPLFLVRPERVAKETEVDRSTPNANKRKKRLAAQFSNPIEVPDHKESTFVPGNKSPNP